MRSTSADPGAAAPRPQAGDRIADRLLVGLLGSGGEGEVWEAERPDGSRCALKLLRPEVLPTPEEVRRRGQWLVRIDHPSLVRVTRGGRFTGGALAGWGFAEMDLLEGASLQDAPALPDALPRLTGVAEALDALHAGVWSDGVPLVHRDVKPGNLIDTPHGLVLVDPSTMRGLDTRDLTRVGTPAYVAPEVATGRFGPLADVYGLGATAAALITGVRGGALQQVLAEPWAYGLPDAVSAALDPDPVRRPHTCAAVTADRSPVVLTERDLQGHAGERHRDTDGTTGADPLGGPSWALPTLSVIALGPAVTWAVSQTRPSLVTTAMVGYVALVAGVLHLGAHLLTGRALAGLLAPPWAWGDLLAGRPRSDLRSVGRRTAWLSDVGAAAVLLMAVGGVSAALLVPDVPVITPGAVLVGLALLWVLRRLSAVHGRATWGTVWTLTLPLRALGGLPRLLVTGSR